MNREIAPIDEALPAVRALFADARVFFKIIGGVAVVHHGYARLTEDIDLLVDSAEQPALDIVLAKNGFTRESRTRLRHVLTGVRVDLLFAGEPGPRAGEPAYPSRNAVMVSVDDADVVSLSTLITMKLRARRHQDLADVVALLKLADEARFVSLEAEIPNDLRPALADLRRDANEELALGEP
ncbi:MAG: hypothetical protein ABI461_06010 [Polyangiaceae bacterium]